MSETGDNKYYPEKHSKKTAECFSSFLFKKKMGLGRVVSILVDDDSIQLACAGRLFFLSRLINATKIYIPSSLNTEESRRNFITGEINKYIHEFKGTFTKYILGVSGPESAFRILTLPRMSRKDLSRAVFYEGNKRIPFDMHHACYGFQVFECGAGEKSGQINVSLIAVSRKEIDQKLQLLQPLNIKIDAIYHEHEALGHLLPHIQDFEKEKTYALINIRKQRSEISFYKGTRLEFIHTCSIGSEYLAPGNIYYEHHEQFMNALLDEIQNSLDFYAGQFSRRFTEKIFVYGDFAYAEELIEKLTNNIGLEFRRFPVKTLIKSDHETDDHYGEIAPVLGAAALAVADYSLLNFIPQEIKEIRSASRYWRYAVPGIILMTAVLLAFWVSLKYKNNIKQGQLESTKAQIQKFINSETFHTYSRIKKQMALDEAYLSKLDRKQSHLHLNLKELSRLTPLKIKLDRYDLRPIDNRLTLQISGKAVSNDPPPEVILAEYIAGLEKSAFYKQVNIRRYSKRQYKGRFLLDFEIEMDAVI